jgi:predicted ATP-grasp superfamily ATP-dependent carboligase
MRTKQAKERDPLPSHRRGDDHDAVMGDDARKEREGTSPTSTHLKFAPIGASSIRRKGSVVRRSLPIQEMCDALVLDARLRQSLVSVRSLGRRNLRAAALETFDGVPAFSSKWCQQKVVSQAEEGTDSYFTYLQEVLTATGAKVLITSSDGTIALIRRHREVLEQLTHIALAKEPALSIAVNKQQTLEIASKLGLLIPRSVLVGTDPNANDIRNRVGARHDPYEACPASSSDVEAALREVGLPAVVKPVESWTGNEQEGARFRPRIVTTLEEGQRAVEAMTRLGGTVLFQQFLDGEREAISFLYAHGHMYARFAQWAKRTVPPLGGTSVLRQSISIPQDIGDQAERLVREIDLEGYSEVEFRRDSAGKPYLMEINPRLSASVEIAVRSGVDFPHLLYQWASGDRIDEVKEYRVGKWMRYLMGDFVTTMASLRHRSQPGVASPAKALFDFCTTFFVPMWYDYLDWSDLGPVWPATVSGLHYILQRATGHKPKE